MPSVEFINGMILGLAISHILIMFLLDQEDRL